MENKHSLNFEWTFVLEVLLAYCLFCMKPIVSDVKKQKNILNGIIKIIIPYKCLLEKIFAKRLKINKET